ncbi:MAG: alpha/beta hydrolase [Planctomycetota bacterium]
MRTPKQEHQSGRKAAKRVLMSMMLSAATFGCVGAKRELPAGVVRESFDFVHGASVSYLRSGDPSGRRVIFVHGTPGDATNFEHFLVPALAIEGVEAVSIDRPGFGESRGTGRVTSYAEQAAAIEALLVERHGKWPVLVGHSLGGPIVSWAAAAYAERVDGLVIVAGNLDPELEQPRWYNQAAKFPLVSAFIGESMRTSNDEILAAPHETSLLDAMVRQITAPTVVLHGTRDSLVPVENADYIERSFTGTSVDKRILEGEGHLIPWRRSEVIREAIVDVLGGK